MPKEIIYQILPRLWGNVEGENRPGGSLERNGCGKFADIDSKTLDYLRTLGVTSVWFTGVVRHSINKPFVKGKAGSPYSITDWFDVNPYLAKDPEGRMTEFESLVRRTHKAGMKVLTDFIPNHVARDYGKFSPKPFKGGRDAAGHPVLGALDDSSVHWKAENDFYYYPGQELQLPCRGTWKEFPAKASGNCFSPAPGEYDWYDTIRLNYCDFHTPTWDRMLEVVLFWAGKGVDGMRCDMVEMVPAEFFDWMIAKVREKHPGFLFIAEVYQKENYRRYIDAGFDYLYDKSGMYDALLDIERRGDSASRLTRNWQELGDLQPHMLNFLENHDEPRAASDFFFGSTSRSFASLHASLLLNTAPFMVYFGQEVGERGMDAEGFSGVNGRTSIFDWWCPSGPAALWSLIHGKGSLSQQQNDTLKRYMELLSKAGEDIITKGLTYDLGYCGGFDTDKVFAFLRGYGKELTLVVCNFSDEDLETEIRIPAEAFSFFGREQGDLFQRVSVGAKDGAVLNLFF